MRMIKCDNCEGKGHVLDGAAAFAAVASLYLIPLLFAEKNDQRGITREKCLICDGKGYRVVKDYNV